MAESIKSFELRKKDHIRLSLEPKTQARGLSDFDRLRLIPEALPDLNFSEVRLATHIWGHDLNVPFFISSMTAGAEASEALNLKLALAAEKHGLLMGVGSQRRQLFDKQASGEWQRIREKAPGAKLLGNIGIAQLIDSSAESILALMESINAVGVFIHLNGLQEVLQAEGTPEFRGAYSALEKFCKKIKAPVIVKEVGCGISEATARRLQSIGVKNIDVGGAGGTHWGRIEGFRQTQGSMKAQAAEVFANWGLSTLDSLQAVRSVFHEAQYKVLASGGVRSGLDIAKCLVLGADLVGLAQPFILAASQDVFESKRSVSDSNPRGRSPRKTLSVLKNAKAVKSMAKNKSRRQGPSRRDSEATNSHIDCLVEQLSFELKTAMFCTGCADLNELKNKKVWSWQA